MVVKTGSSLSSYNCSHFFQLSTEEMAICSHISPFIFWFLLLYRAVLGLIFNLTCPCYVESSSLQQGEGKTTGVEAEALVRLNSPASKDNTPFLTLSV